MLKALTVILCAALLPHAHAADSTVVDVRRNITLSEDDPVYKDFYINVDSSSGLKKNMVVTAVRKINIRDASGASAVGEIMVPVGQLKVIAVFDKVAVAREYTLLSRDELPMLEQIGIMVGDRIETKGSFIDNSKPKPKRKVAEESAPAVAPTTTVVVATTVTPPATPTPAAPVETSKANAAPNAAPLVVSSSKAETLEKAVVSGNNSLHE